MFVLQLKDWIYRLFFLKKIKKKQNSNVKAEQCVQLLQVYLEK